MKKSALIFIGGAIFGLVLSLFRPTPAPRTVEVEKVVQITDTVYVYTDCEKKTAARSILRAYDCDSVYVDVNITDTSRQSALLHQSAHLSDSSRVAVSPSSGLSPLGFGVGVAAVQRAGIVVPVSLSLHHPSGRLSLSAALYLRPYTPTKFSVVGAGMRVNFRF